MNDVVALMASWLEYVYVPNGLHWNNPIKLQTTKTPAPEVSAPVPRMVLWIEKSGTIQLMYLHTWNPLMTPGFGWSLGRVLRDWPSKNRGKIRGSRFFVEEIQCTNPTPWLTVSPQHSESTFGVWQASEIGRLSHRVRSRRSRKCSVHKLHLGVSKN